MATATSSTQAFPPLTADGLRRVIPVLNADLAAVHASTAPDSVKERTRQLVEIMKATFTAVADNDADSAGDWVAMMADPFQELTDNLRSALALPAAGIGRCMYTNSAGNFCIQCTQTQCQALGGAFQANTPCP